MAGEDREVDRLEGTPHPRLTMRLFGHEAAERAFLDAYRSGKLPHAWLIGGPEGIGKASFAYRVARFVLANPDPVALGDVRDLAVDPAALAARKVAARSHPDLFVLRRQSPAEGKPPPSLIPVEMVRAAVQFFGSTAAEGGWRICILDSAEELNRFGLNALLKVVEEPPARALFLIVSHRPGGVLPTIRSRCRALQLSPLPPAAIISAIEAFGETIDHGLVARAATLADGSVRDACKLLDERTIAVVEHIRAMLDGLPSLDWKDLHEVADSLSSRLREADFETTTATIFAWLSQQTRARSGEGAARLAPLAEVWDKVSRGVREADIYNLDRRALILTLFADLARAVHDSRAA